MPIGPELPDDLGAWCTAVLGAEPARVLHSTAHLSRVYVAELTNSRLVVLKSRPDEPRLAHCCEVQRHLVAAGFPGPALLAGPAVIGGQFVSAEEYLEGDDPRPADVKAAATVTAIAAMLHRLIQLAPPASECAGLRPAPAWLRYDHEESGTWPVPDDLGADLNATPGPAAVETAGRRLRARLRAATLPDVAGHLDVEAHNLRWRDGRPAALLDWDSAGLRPEAVVAGAAAAVWPSLGDSVAATLAQTTAFLGAYQQARGVSFTPEETEVAWAAGAWVLNFNARKEAARGLDSGPYRRILAADGPERLRRAGIR